MCTFACLDKWWIKGQDISCGNKEASYHRLPSTIWPIYLPHFLYFIIICKSAKDQKFITVWYYRSSHQRCSVKKGVLRNFAKFTGKHLCQSLFSNNVAGGTFEIQKQNHPLEKCSAVLTNVFLKILFLCTSILILIT